jgi:squalene-associated FAD-dependent desaturase
MTARAANVAIIGAGWAGMAAAVELADSGIPVSVFEASRSLGGRARRVDTEGVALDNGQHILIGAYIETLSMMRRVGADPDKVLMRLPLQLRYADGFSLAAPRWPAPLHLAAALLGAKGLGIGQRLAAIAFMQAMKRAKFRVDPALTVAGLLDRHGQRGALNDFLWEPLCVSALNTPATSASAQVFLNVLRDSLTGRRENSDMLLPRIDLSAMLPEPAAAYVGARHGKVLRGEAVRRIRRDDAGWRLDERPESFSHVIIAVGPQHASALLADQPELDAARKLVDAFEYQPIYTCYLQYPPHVSLSSPMLGFTGGAIQWAFDRGALSDRPGLIAVVVSASGAHQDMSQDAFCAAVHAELRNHIGGTSAPSPLWQRVIAEKRATFACTPELVRPANRTALHGILLAGDYTDSPYPATLETAVRSGIACARIVAGRA